MSLSRVEREQLHDSKLKLESVAQALSKVDPANVKNFGGIQECLEDARNSLSDALTKTQDEQMHKPS
jgi:hypothetical protein